MGKTKKELTYGKRERLAESRVLAIEDRIEAMLEPTNGCK